MRIDMPRHYWNALFLKLMGMALSDADESLARMSAVLIGRALKASTDNPQHEEES